MAPPGTPRRLAALLALCLAGPAVAQVTQRVNLSSSGLQGDGTSARQPDLSADGRYVVFEDSADDLVAGDTNGVADVFLRDRQTGTTVRVSVDSSGAEGNGESHAPCISADGLFVAFHSKASNLVANDTNGVQDVFVRDLAAGTTTRVSVDSLGAPGNGDSFYPGLSGDGRLVVFMSEASTLVPSDTNGQRDIFLHDRQTGATTRMSESETGVQGDGDCPLYASISRDGRYVLFYSDSTNLVPGDTNGAHDVFLRDLQLGELERISVATGGTQSNGNSSLAAITDDGRYVTFMSIASNLAPGDTNGVVDCFLRDRVLRTTERISVPPMGGEGDGHSEYPMPTADGSFVVFTSNSTNLVPGDTNGMKDVFVLERATGAIERVSVSTQGAQGNGLAYYYPTISADGRFVAFACTSSNLVAGDTNTGYDVFVRDRAHPGYPSLCDPGTGGVIACPCSNPPSGPGRGCDNSASTGGAVLGAAGGAYLSSDSLFFVTSGERATALSIVLQGTASLPGGAIFGQGVRCVGGALKRLYTKSAVGGSVTAPVEGSSDPTVHARSATLGDAIAASSTRWYMVYYRDPFVLGGCPAVGTFNGTQTVEVTWEP